ncbi:MAG: threonylcarbamoyl-AMP synthase [Puniceicoccales bacterium]|jgi:L-threonylcarbamoyladenylate synthase|nr:threonylcarbamoyl-AMP synthase [Puniceicoccales bacterium]
MPIEATSTAPLPPFLPSTPDGVLAAAALLREGEIVALPTETVYGLAADALNEAAVRRIFAAKGRPFFDPLIVHLPAAGAVADLAEIPAALEALARRFWPGPLTLVLRKKPCVPDVVTAGGPTVAVRVPAHPLMRRVLEACALPLAAPSANPFGYVSPTRAEHVRDSLGSRAPWVLDGGECRHGLESTILHLATQDGVPALLRPGPVSRDELEEVLGMRVRMGAAAATEPAPPTAEIHGGAAVSDEALAEAECLPAPGMLSRHYSPRTPVLLRAAGTPPRLLADVPRQAVVWQRKPPHGAESSKDVFWFSESGLPADVARGVFSLLRRLDGLGYALLHVELAPDSPLAPAINDRLRRAAARRAG